MISKSSEWNKRNPEKQKEAKRRWLEKNPGKQSEHSVKWKKANADKVKEYRKTPISRYANHKSRAKERGIDFNLTFDQWWHIWDSSGKWEQRGCRKGEYVMCRTGDMGAYEVGNVRIDTCSNNIRESFNGTTRPKHIVTDETRAKMSASKKNMSDETKRKMCGAQTGKILSDETKAKISAAMKGKNRQAPWNKGKKGVQVPWNKGKKFVNGICSKANETVPNDNPPKEFE